jgi:hypothetical protein
MYRDFDVSIPEQHDLEKRPSRLEGDASDTVTKIRRPYTSGAGEVQLIRKDKDLLRRFIWIMHYRNRTAAGRYKKSAEDYGGNDRGAMLAYMRAKVFAKPQDVWFSNIRTFLDVDLISL